MCEGHCCHCWSPDPPASTPLSSSFLLLLHIHLTPFFLCPGFRLVSSMDRFCLAPSVVCRRGWGDTGPRLMDLCASYMPVLPAQGSFRLLATGFPQPKLLSTLPFPSDTAFQEFLPQQLPLTSPCLSRDQVLRILAKDEEQLSLLSKLEGMKPQKVKIPRAWGHAFLPPPQTCSPR